MMVAFGITITDDKAIPAILEVRKNLLVDDLLKNPFEGKITAHGKSFFTVVLKPVYPQVYLFSFFPFALSLLFSNAGLWRTAFLTIGFVMLSTRMFWSNWFYYLLFRYKTKGGIRYVSASDSLARVV